MKSEAIRCAIKLHSEPAVLARFDDPFRRLPRGITELLRLVSSDVALQQLSKKNNLDAIRFKKILLNYIEAVLLQENNSDLRKLGLEQCANKSQKKLHYKLLMNIFHPDKGHHNSSQYHRYTQLVSQAYKQVKSNSPSPSLANKPIPSSRFAVPLVQSNNIPFDNHQIFAFSHRKISVKKAFILPSVAIFLIALFVLFSLLMPSSRSFLVKKSMLAEFVNEFSSKTMPVFEERKQSTLVESGEQQQLSKNESKILLTQ